MTRRMTPEQIRGAFGPGSGTKENSIEALNDLVCVMGEMCAQVAELNELMRSKEEVKP